MASRLSFVSGVLAVFAAVLGLHGACLAAPSVSWGSYLGGSEIEFSGGVAVDGSGSVYVVGSTLSDGWVSGGLDNSLATPEYDGFAVKLNASGGHVWSTYLGDSGPDGCADVAADTGGNVFITGHTSSSGWFGGGGAWVTTDPGPGRDGFVMKLDSAGAPVWSTYLGGTEDDDGAGLALDASGNVFATGATRSVGWVSGGWDTQHSGANDAYLVKLTASGGHEWSTFLGGADNDWGQDLSADSSGNVYVGGFTNSPGWIGTGSWDASLGGSSDGFVVKASPAGVYLWGTYVGGAQGDSVSAVAAGSNDTVFATGYTSTGEWVSGGWDTTHAGDTDGFVVRLDMGGTLGWSACFGGQYQDIASGVALSGNTVYITGTTSSGGWVSGGWNTTLVENGLTTSDGFVLRLTLAGAHLWSGYTGGTTAGSGQTNANGITTGAGGAVYVTGVTREGGWLSGGWNTSGGGVFSGDAYVLKFTDLTVPNLLFMLRADAEAAILAAGLNIGTVYEAHNPSVPEGQVASQDPVAGALAGAGDAVSFVLSLGPAPVIVPNLASLTRANAEAEIVAAGLTVGGVTEVNSDSVPPGLVISQNPAAFTQVSAGTPVALVVSLGTQTAGTIVPNVVGMTRTAAEAAITAANLTVGTVSEATSLTVPTGQVISQNPAAGTSVPVVMTTVSFTVSLGPAPQTGTVPNVVGMTQAAAEAAVTAAGLAPGTAVAQYSDTAAAGLVSSQNPAAGTTAAPGTAVSLVVSLGPDPDLVADARDSLADDFNDADADDSNTLTLAEAQSVIPALTQLTFNALDTNADGVLDREELGADNGCGCGGCSCERSSLTFVGIKHRLGDLFLGGLALALLAVMGRRDRS